MSEDRSSFIMWILLICFHSLAGKTTPRYDEDGDASCFFSLSGSPPLRYHFQHYKGAEFQNGPSVVSRPLQYIARNGNTFSNNRLHWARPAYSVQYQGAYGGVYTSYPCQNLFLQRLRYRPCQYQTY